MSDKTQIAKRLEYLRQELRAERISYEELAELQSLAPSITPGDVELLEAAGVPETETTD
jgi:predicted transcriptional regulator